MASALRSVLLASFVCGLTALLAPGCSQQSEGERCDKVKAQNSDCDSGLVCIAKEQLLDDQVDRCCPPIVGDESDSRCRRGTGTPTGEGGSPSDTGGQPGVGGEPSASVGGVGGEPVTPPETNGGAPEAIGGTPNAGAPATDAGGAAGVGVDVGVGGAAGAGGA